MNSKSTDSKPSMTNRQLWALRAAWLLALTIATGLLLYGPVAQLANYHDFADKRHAWGIPCFADVMSNLGFTFAGIYGLWQWRQRTPGYTVFLVFLLLTGIGSAYYHWEPNNARLIWDRLPISMVCSGLLVGAYFEVNPKKQELLWTIAMAAFAVFGVWWWNFTESQSVLGEPPMGDLRPYLYLQLMPLLLIPLWQYAYAAPIKTKKAFASAIGFYALAKIFELLDHRVFEGTGFISGHTLKHLLATLGGASIVWYLVTSTRKLHKQA